MINIYTIQILHQYRTNEAYNRTKTKTIRKKIKEQNKQTKHKQASKKKNQKKNKKTKNNTEQSKTEQSKTEQKRKKRKTQKKKPPHDFVPTSIRGNVFITV